MLKRFALVAIALLGVSFASAKTYTFKVSDACKAGPVQLQPGEYKLKLEGSKVVLIDPKGRTIEAPAKVEDAGQKFSYTSVATSKAEGENRLEWIGLAGTRNKIIFQE